MHARFLILALLMSPLALAQSADRFTIEDLQRAESERDAALARLKRLETSAESADRELADIDADLLSAAADSRRREEAAQTAEARLAVLAVQLQDAERHLKQDEASRDDLLAALMALSAQRPPAMVASPEDAGGAVRSAILIGDAAPALASRARALKSRIVELNRVRAETAAEQAHLKSAEDGLAARRDEIAALADSKRLAKTSLDAEADRLRQVSDKYAKQADTLRDLLDKLAADAPSAPRLRPKPAQPAATAAAAKPAKPSGKPRDTKPSAILPASKGAPITPALGEVVHRFGSKVDGERFEGLALKTRAGAQVVSPLDARVEFSGPFRSYGQMLILNMGDNVLVIVAGLDRIYATTGQWVLAGEPVGRMGDQTAPPPELYLEVRKKGATVDPQVWLARR
jgi:septal ring factor EnvC (AmiA/AmiB activator)